MYGFEKEPFNLPILLTPIMLALKYVIHRSMVDHFLFYQHRKAITFPLKREVGPFFSKKIKTFIVAEEMVKQFYFKKDERWLYDPHGVISTRNPT